MKRPDTQRGLSGVGLIFVLAVIALAAIVVVKCLPLYLNEMKVVRTLKTVSEDAEMKGAGVAQVRTSLQRHWDIEDINGLTPSDVKLKRTSRGRELAYAYEARAHLFYNISIVIDFKGEYLMLGDGSAGVDD